MDQDAYHVYLLQLMIDAVGERRKLDREKQEATRGRRHT